MQSKFPIVGWAWAANPQLQPIYIGLSNDAGGSRSSSRRPDGENQSQERKQQSGKQAKCKWSSPQEKQEIKDNID